MATGMLDARLNSGRSVSSLFLGSSKREAEVLGIATWVAFWAFALSSTVAGVGWYRSPPICTGTEMMAYDFDLNPVHYLPYWIAGWGRCHPVFYENYRPYLNRSLLGHLVEPPGSPQLYLLTVLWWVLASYAIGRLLSFSYVRVRPGPVIGGGGGTG